MSQQFERHVYAVQHYSALTKPCYAALYDPQVVSAPICCFGDPLNAQVVTVGLNPSKRELGFLQDAEPIAHAELARRCRQYFAGENPHKWFEPWAEALGYLGASYTDGTAVHLDLSPRVVRFVSELQQGWEQELFLQMVQRDLWTFFGTLTLCAKARLMLIAGSVTGRYYMNEFLQRFAPDYGHSLGGCFNPFDQSGSGKTAFHTLSGGGRTLHVFFCSASPSARNKKLLPEAIKANAKRLKRLQPESAVDWHSHSS